MPHNTYKAITRGTTDKKNEAPRFVRIRSFKIALQDIIKLCDQNMSSMDYITSLKGASKETTTYFLPLPLTIDDDSAQSWDKSGLMSDVMSGIADKAQWLQAYQGVGIQPYYSQTYMGQIPRTINLSFLINVETAAEFTEINKMLLSLKRDMSPGIGKPYEGEGAAPAESNSVANTVTEAASYILLPPPRLFDLQFGKSNSPINRIIRYDLCALQSMDINYGTDGFMGFHPGFVPKYISVNMSFAEYEPKEKKDWK